MGVREVIELSDAYIEVEARPGYLFVVESGQLTRLGELRRYTARLDAVARRLGRDRALIDARGELGEPPQSVRQAMWAWLTGEDRAIRSFAFVLPSEMAVARVNMTALACKARLRAFDSVQAAQRWLLRDPRVSSAGTQAKVETQPPREPADSGRRPKLRPGAYISKDAPADHVNFSSDEEGGGGSRVA